MSREEIEVLLTVMQTELVEDLHHRAVYTSGPESAALTETANAIDGISIAYHISQIDERVREANEDSA